MNLENNMRPSGLIKREINLPQAVRKVDMTEAPRTGVTLEKIEEGAKQTLVLNLHGEGPGVFQIEGLTGLVGITLDLGHFPRRDKKNNQVILNISQCPQLQGERGKEEGRTERKVGIGRKGEGLTQISPNLFLQVKL